MYGVDAVEQVFAEFALRDHAEQVAVGGAYQADVRFDGRVAAHADDPAALNGRQQFGLQAGGEVADLVEKERAPVCHFEFPGPVGPCVGERPFDVAEQFAFEERFGHRAHVHRDHQFVAAERTVVYLARQHLLARAVLARDEDIGVGRRYLLDDFADAGHRGTRAPEHRLFGRQFAFDLLELFHLAL